MSNGVKVCYSTTIAGYLLELQQTGKGRYRVVYGMDQKEGLTYSGAAEELGSCIMHALTLEGKLDDE